MSFHLTFDAFKIRKKIKVGKIRKSDEETDYLEKKRFHPSKRHI